ncbi:MAG TPA: hypothetical protein VIG67_05405 [Yaniella sp.]
MNAETTEVEQIVGERTSEMERLEVPKVSIDVVTTLHKTRRITRLIYGRLIGQTVAGRPTLMKMSQVESSIKAFSANWAHWMHRTAPGSKNI